MQLGLNFSLVAPSTGGCLIALGLRLWMGLAEALLYVRGHLFGGVDVQRRLLRVRTSDFDEEFARPTTSREFCRTVLLNNYSRNFSDAAIEPSHPLGSTT